MAGFDTLTVSGASRESGQLCDSPLIGTDFWRLKDKMTAIAREINLDDTNFGQPEPNPKQNESTDHDRDNLVSVH